MVSEQIDPSFIMTDNTIIPNTTDPAKPFTLVQIYNAIKLTSTNYVAWETQLQAILLGYDLWKYVDGSFPTPSSTIDDGKFLHFKTLVENIFNRKIKQLFSENGGEYVKLTPYLSTHGISHLTSPPHTPEHNDYAERRHCHIVETSLSLLTHANLPFSYWLNAIYSHFHLFNQSLTYTNP